MSSSVYQGMQLCLEARLVEAHAPNDKLSSIRSNFSPSIPWSRMPNLSSQPQEQNGNSCNIITNKYCSDYQCNSGKDLCWSFLQTLADNIAQAGRQANAEAAEQVYAVKRPSASTLSFETCTESLGSESGSSIDEIIEDLFHTPPEKQSYNGIQRSRSRVSGKKPERRTSLPPPLTSISGSEGIEMRSHREGGRLVLKAVSSPSRSCFRAERVDGRLRLFTITEDCQNGGKLELDVKSSEELESEEQTDDGGDEEEEEEEEVYNTNNETKWSEEGLEKNCANIESEIGVEKFPRLSSRCKEGGAARNRGVINLGPVGVAIS